MQDPICRYPTHFILDNWFFLSTQSLHVFVFPFFYFQKTPFAGQASKEEPAFWVDGCGNWLSLEKNNSFIMDVISQAAWDWNFGGISSHRDAEPEKIWKEMRRNKKEL